jgi:Xaa-Pro aminopeptidase
VHPPEAVERIGPTFVEPAIAAAREATWDALRAIASLVHPGMTQGQATTAAGQLLKTRGLSPGWHKVMIRFGPNSALNYWQRSDASVVLRENDIYFVDIGPVLNGIEGDAGDTFVVGDDEEMQSIADDIRAVWKETSDCWRSGGISGHDLYHFAVAAAAGRGWVLDTDVAGHRLSEFPHKAYHDGTLSGADFVPSSARWVLETQIRHPDGRYGAFFEDLLDN